MPIFYTLHSILPWSDSLTEGQRNCRLFMIGSFIYVIIYVLLKNLQYYGYIDKIMIDAYLNALFYLILADAAVMAYIYKSYYGRSILNEVNADDKDSDKWIYDNNTHKYYVKPEQVKILEKEIVTDQCNEVRKKYQEYKNEKCEEEKCIIID
jgi:hypothetical protein